MQLHENSHESAKQITAITEQSISINSEVFNSSCIISNARLITDIDIHSVDDLRPEHIDYLLDSEPGLILLGSGSQHVFPAIDLLTPIAKQNIGFEVMNNKSAARTYNVLVAEDRKVACLLII